jgi:hypothetical protein
MYLQYLQEVLLKKPHSYGLVILYKYGEINELNDATKSAMRFPTLNIKVLKALMRINYISNHSLSRAWVSSASIIIISMLSLLMMLMTISSSSHNGNFVT